MVFTLIVFSNILHGHHTSPGSLFTHRNTISSHTSPHFNHSRIIAHHPVTHHRTPLIADQPNSKWNIDRWLRWLLVQWPRSSSLTCWPHLSSYDTTLGNTTKRWLCNTRRLCNTMMVDISDRGHISGDKINIYIYITIIKMIF